MNKEDVLKKSREEYKSADERQKLLHQKAQAISGAVGLALCCVIALLEGVFGDSVILFYGCFSIYWGITAANSIVLAVTVRNKYGWFALVNVILFVGFIIKLLEALTQG